MTTSLAAQLQRLTVTQTTLLARDKKKASLLFDPKEAASLRKEIVHQIGLDGLEELIARNPEFERFKLSIFDMGSKEFERAVHTAETNTKLDKMLRRFLLLLSPYFLMRCAHKTLEWLIHRYHIHEYNREDLLMLIMPYHESNIFVRVVQLMKFKELGSDSWYFLKSLQKPGVHLTRNSLLGHASSDPYFLKFLANFISKLIKVHRNNPGVLTIAFNFYCTTLTGTIDHINEITESQITHIITILLKGLSSDAVDFCAASYVITARLLLKTTLTDAVLYRLVEKIAQVSAGGLETEAVLVLIVLYQSQIHFHDLSEKAYESLLAKKWLPTVLEELNAAGSYVYPFLQVLVKGTLAMALKKDQDNKADRNYLEAILVTVRFDGSFVEALLGSMLDGWKGKSSKQSQNWLTKIFESIEKQHPESFDKVIYKILSDHSADKKSINRRKKLQQILNHAMALKEKFDIFEKLYHPNQHLRVQAMKFLQKNYHTLRQTEKDVIKRTLIDRLNDGSGAVVKEALNLVKKVPKLLSRKELIEIFTKLLRNNNNNNYDEEVIEDVALLLCENSNGNNWGTFLVIFPYLLPQTDSEMKLSVELLNSRFGSENSLLKYCVDIISYNKSKTLNPKQFCTRIINSLRNNNNNRNNNKILIDFIQVLNKDNNNLLDQYVAMLILSIILPNKCDIKVSALIVNIFDMYYDSNHIQSNLVVSGINKKSHPRLCIRDARKGLFPIDGFFSCLETVVAKTKILNIDDNFGLIDLHDSTNDRNNFFVTVFKQLNTATDFNRILKYFCTDLKSKIELLLNLTMCQHPSLNQSAIIRCLNQILYELKHDLHHRHCLLDNNNKIVPFLLGLLLNESEQIRRLSLDILNEFTSIVLKSNPTNYLFKSLLIGILKQQDEISVDSDQISLVMFNLLSADLSLKSNQCLNYLVSSCLSNQIMCPIYLKSSIIDLLSHLNTCEIFEKTSELAVKLLLQRQNGGGRGDSLVNEFDSIQSNVIVKTIQRFSTFNAVDLNPTSTKSIWNLLELSLKNDSIKICIDDNPDKTIGTLILDQFDKDFFTNLNTNVEHQILDLIIDMVAITQNPNILPSANRIFKHIDLDAKLIENQLNQMRDIQSAKRLTQKRRRVSTIPTIDILDTIQWRKGVIILEFIQNKKKIRNASVLIALLFDLLKKCLDFDEQAPVEYVKQLILSTILNLCEKFDENNESMSENVFNMELIVQCVRASNNPQTHHHALLVLAHAATLMPTQVLHNILAIFTFMGSSVLRHDDTYSYQIISKIIDTIIPILVDDNKVETIAKVLRVFVDAILDVPVHRRMPLYQQLLTQIDVSENLYLFLLLVFEAHVTSATSNTNQNSSSTKMIRLDIATSLCLEFPPSVILYNCIKLIKYLKDLPEEKTNEVETSNSVTFDIGRYTPKQFRHYKYTLITFIGNLLSSKEFVEQVAALSDNDLHILEDLYKNMIINILTYIQATSKVTDKTQNTPQSQYWKTILHHSYDILDSTNALLTPQMFLLVIKGLLSHKLSTVRRRTLDLLNAKLQYNSTYFNDCNETEIYIIVPPLVAIIATIKQSTDNEESLESDQELIIQTALLSMNLLAKLLAQQWPDKFVQILEFISQVIKYGKTNKNVLASVVLCLAELCVNLRAHAISSLSTFMPGIIKILKHEQQNVTSSNNNNLLLLSTITAIQKILDTLALFLSPYLSKLLYELCVLASKHNDQTTTKLDVLHCKLVNVQQRIGDVIPPRVLIPLVEQCYTSLIEERCFDAIGPLMQTLIECIKKLNGVEITSNLPDLTSFFLSALQLRSSGATVVTHAQANRVEGDIVQAFTCLILKLSESTFRPLYYKLYDWAVRSEVKNERLITFYSLSSDIASRLKGLFVLFAGHFLNNAAQTLDACNQIKCNTTTDSRLYFDDDEKNIMLIEYIFKTLLAIFTYDTQKFINKDRFEVLMQPLVDQLENMLGGLERLEARCNQLITPCLVQFAVATADDALWKQFNYQVLLKMRHQLPNIRIVALHCLMEIVRKLGEDFLPLLPETIPFLAELLEDEEENVEKACRTAVQEMEKILGEPLQKYF